MKIDMISDLKKQRQQKGLLKSEDFTFVAEKHKRPVADVYAVSTFYSETSPQGRGIYQINLCKSLPCRMKNLDDILRLFQQELNIEPGEVTEDGWFSLHMVNCIGACDKAPAMLVNGKLYGNLTLKGIKEILNELKLTTPEVQLK
jgi:NADH:ubiquinone oxidoreductase subunit E